MERNIEGASCGESGWNQGGWKSLPGYVFLRSKDA